MVELALGACLYNGHVQITLLNNFVFDEFFFFFLKQILTLNTLFNIYTVHSLEIYIKIINH